MSIICRPHRYIFSRFIFVSSNLRGIRPFLTTNETSPRRAQPLSYNPRMFIGPKILITRATIGRKSTHVQQSVTSVATTRRRWHTLLLHPSAVSHPASVPRFIVFAEQGGPISIQRSCLRRRTSCEEDVAYFSVVCSSELIDVVG